ncbi:vomeronasal type-2 receptor 26-like [Leptodactylus fuscus]|uniref:vomeronasal type-2 receptor 26-like n=1 Tax=Leptodactylus fuscus TaxID=238119 RepID=UPI003F4F0606
MVQDYEYVQDGDIMIGGVVTVYGFTICDKPPEDLTCSGPIINYYKNLLALLYAMDEINKYPQILPNLTLGYHIYDSCADPRKAIKNILQILSGPGYVVPNYSCTKNKVVGFIGDHFSSTTIPIAHLLGIYPYTQISYGATDTSLNDRELFPSFFRTVPDDYTTFVIISHFLKHFGWTWVGIIASDDDNGDKEIKMLTDCLRYHSICVDFALKSSKKINKDNIRISSKKIKNSSAQIIVICGPYSIPLHAFIHDLRHAIGDRILILNPAFSPEHSYFSYSNMRIFNLSLCFVLSTKKDAGQENYFKNFHFLKNPNDEMYKEIVVMYFRCASGIERIDKAYGKAYKKTLPKCNGREPLGKMFHFFSQTNTYQMNLAVMSVAVALDNMYMALGHQSIDQMYQHRHKLHNYIEDLKFPDESGTQRHFFTESGYRESSYVVQNFIIVPEPSWNTVGSYKLNATEDEVDFWLHRQNITWKNAKNEPEAKITVSAREVRWCPRLVSTLCFNPGAKIPRSQCSAPCSPGHKKVATSSIHLCCYDCAPCSDGEVSNRSDSKKCMKCPEDSWPNENRTICVMKEMEYLSYTEDIVSVAFQCLSSFFCILTILIFVLFYSKRDTPIVRANNKNLSFVLLVSIMLSFLCVFLFLGRPVDITCMLRQISTGILLSVSISSLLAKTIMVCIAFKATKPGSMWRTWTGVKLPNSVLLICSSVQVVLCMSWVTLSPPFQELDIHSYKKKTVVQCNEGSDLWFYSVLGYMGVLAAISFIIAFLVRTLPDSFNEAKYITFSMLVFCSVWIAMIPAYLSTKGKYMVAVEIFAILTSNTGLLGCIFIHKCYIILFKPELNTKKHILDR